MHTCHTQMFTLKWVSLKPFLSLFHPPGEGEGENEVILCNHMGYSLTSQVAWEATVTTWSPGADHLHLSFPLDTNRSRQAHGLKYW